MKKYELTDETKVIDDVTLHRIRALIDIPLHGVKAGDLGGWIEAERNLSQKGTAWVADEAWVADNAWVFGNAWVADRARMFGEAWASDESRVFGNALVFDNAQVFGNAWVQDDAKVFDCAKVFDDALVSGFAKVSDWALVGGNAIIKANASIKAPSDVLTIGAIGSRDDTTTFYRGADGGIYVSCGCFSGSIDDFAAKVKAVHAGTKHEKTYLLAVELAKAQMNVESEVNK